MCSKKSAPQVPPPPVPPAPAAPLFCKGHATDDADGDWYCTHCFMNMGPTNPRQLCCKIYCPNDTCKVCNLQVKDFFETNK